MPKRLSVDPHALNHAATTVAARGDEWVSGHAAASSRISSARLGWTGRSADALAGRAAKWDSRAKALQHQIENHANDIRVTATSFTQADENHSTVLRNVAAGLPNPD
ncbi:WXG100 family type VII secretion target [Mycolicibacterium mengxianglii]|uniref:WXG100 family type VII secretion target n=1 Tax=Mycolicibacterium mengxianglii TaxID=2736649 RepID=UPI0018EEE2BB|nr:WXG100 family type VII secretion target [Mycolicibacterium mengxianglii]